MNVVFAANDSLRLESLLGTAEFFTLTLEFILERNRICVKCVTNGIQQNNS